MSRRPGSPTSALNRDAIPAERRAVAQLLQHWLAADTRHSLTYLETLTGISRQGLSDLLNCKRLPKPDTCKILASALGVPPETLLIAAGHMPMPPSVPLVTDVELVGYLRWTGLLRPEKLTELKEFFRQAYAEIGSETPVIRPIYARPYTDRLSGGDSTKDKPDA